MSPHRRRYDRTAYVEYVLPFSRTKAESAGTGCKASYTCSELTTDVLLKYSRAEQAARLRDSVRTHNWFRVPFLSDRNSTATISPGDLVGFLSGDGATASMGEPEVHAAINSAHGLPWDAHLV